PLPGRSKRFSAGRKAMVLLGFVLALAIANVCMVRSMLGQFNDVGATVNVSGKLRMLSQRTAFEAMALPFAGDRGWDAVQEVIQEFDRATQVLSGGGEIYNIWVKPLDAMFVPQLDQLKEEWAIVKANIQPV